MFVTQLETGRNLLTDLERLNRKFVDVNRQLSSGKKLNELSDSPLSSADLVHVTEEALRLEAYQLNITLSTHQLKSADNALNQANNVFTAVFPLASEAANETINNDGRFAILNEIKGLREELIAFGNTQVNGLYIFAGTNVTQKPFELNDTIPTAHVTTYHGNENVKVIPVGEGVSVTSGVNGKEAFMTILSKTDDIINAIEATIDDNTGANATLISEALKDFDKSLTELGLARGQVGVNLKEVERMSTVIDARDAVLQAHRSRLEDANALEVIVQVNQLQTAMNAALSSGGMVLQQSTLFDLIG